MGIDQSFVDSNEHQGALDNSYAARVHRVTVAAAATMPELPIVIKRADVVAKIVMLQGMLENSNRANDMGTIENIRGQISVYRALQSGNFPDKRAKLLDPHADLAPNGEPLTTGRIYG